MRVLVKLLLVVGLLAAHAPGCKVAAAQALVPARSHSSHGTDEPVAKCNKACCAPADAPLSDEPKSDRIPSEQSKCPANCLNPLCSPAPALQPPSTDGSTTDLGPVEQVLPQPKSSPAAAFHSRLDRPPRA